ncbi:hypothetical protein BDZ89DRAFT_434681 [Hymenopellis radicata]|nr:hypothetical protein BDZ89DRAFT_434681 [Hymenopellis radicata]
MAVLGASTFCRHYDYVQASGSLQRFADGRLFRKVVGRHGLWPARRSGLHQLRVTSFAVCDLLTSLSRTLLRSQSFVCVSFFKVSLISALPDKILIMSYIFTGANMYNVRSQPLEFHDSVGSRRFAHRQRRVLYVVVFIVVYIASSRTNIDLIASLYTISNLQQSSSHDSFDIPISRRGTWTPCVACNSSQTRCTMSPTVTYARPSEGNTTMGRVINVAIIGIDGRGGLVATLFHAHNNGDAAAIRRTSVHGIARSMWIGGCWSNG